MTHANQVKGSGQADEIEITPEMLEAGEWALRAWQEGIEDCRAGALRVFGAMLRARNEPVQAVAEQRQIADEFYELYKRGPMLE